MAMLRKHYTAMADLFGKIKDERDRAVVVRGFMEIAKQDNSNFNTQRFQDAVDSSAEVHSV